MTIRMAGFVAAIIGSALASAQADELWRATGFRNPESVVLDTAEQRLIVSNVNGDPLGADGNGYLSTVGLDGKILSSEWVGGMDAPKGMALLNGRLYVADINVVRVVDPASAQIEQSISVEGASFLNDVAADPASGSIFVSDTATNAIYRLQGGTVDVWLKSDALDAPNGLLVDGDRLLVASFGGSGPDGKGSIHSINLQSKEIADFPAGQALGALDGITKIGDAVYVSDFMGGKVFVFNKDAAVSRLGFKIGSADIGTDGASLFVPMMQDGELIAVKP